MLDVVVTDAAGDEALAAIREGVIAFNLEATGFGRGRPLTALAHDEDGALVGGLDGFTWGGYAMVDWLWARGDWRGRGLGRRLLAAGEEEAARRGCAVVRVNTHTFQAPGFYERLGYERLGMARDTPAGHGELFLAKRLPAPRPTDRPGRADRLWPAGRRGC